MTYKVTWHNRALVLTLSGHYTVDEAAEANQFILNYINQSQAQFCIIIDTTEMNRPFNFGDIRKAQTFMDSSQISHICIVSGDRLIRLSMMVIFNLCKARVHLCEDIDAAKLILNKFEKIG